MGRKITVDSATLANKALEVIEAHFLFGLPYDRIEVVVHPQSIVHSFVEFVDGSVLAQLGVPSMELPVLYALTHPDRVADSGVPQFDPVALIAIDVRAGCRLERFPAFALGVAAGRQGGAAPAVFNAANEAAVALFLDGRIHFRDIGVAIAGALDALGGLPGDSRDTIVAADCRGASPRSGTVWMLAILSPILVFGLVIFVHELGHFLAAKATGVYAPRFSIGFGPAIFRFRKGETEYVLAVAAARRLCANGLAARRRDRLPRGRAEEGPRAAATDKGTIRTPWFRSGPSRFPRTGGSRASRYGRAS